jgi:hypothetical protein
MAIHTNLSDIIGLPPEYDSNPDDAGTVDMNQLIRDTMPILEIEPSMPELSKGMQGFTMKKSPAGTRNFQKELADFYGIGMRNDSLIRVAFQANNPPTETFNNDYGESLVEGIANVASSGIRDISFATGGMKLSGAAAKAAGALETKAEGSSGMSEKVLQGAGDIMNQFSQGAKKAEGISKTATGLLMGNRVDFPQVWKNSSFSPNYSVTIKLYNPYPGDERATFKLITAPLITLLMFVTPYSEDGSTFSWPWCMRFHIPGLVQWHPGYVKSISVVKGGNDNLIGYNQRPSIVEINMDLGLLYSSILHTNTNVANSDVPNLNKYAREFSDENSKRINPSKYYQYGAGPSKRADKTALQPSNVRESNRSVEERVTEKYQDADEAINDFIENDLEEIG